MKQQPPFQPYPPQHAQQPPFQPYPPQHAQQPPFQPYPPQHTQQSPNKNNINIFALIGSFFTLIGIVISCQGYASSNNSNTDTASPTQSVVIKKVGDTITSNGISCTVISVQSAKQSLLGVLIVHVRLVNNSNDEFDYYLQDFHIKDAKGVINDANYDFSQIQLTGEALAPKGEVEGDIGFIVNDEHKAQLIWQPGDTNDLSNVWDLNL